MRKIEGDGVLDKVFCHDDSLLFRGQKNEIDLDADWYRVMPKDGKVTGYRRPKTPIVIGKNGWAVCDWKTPEEYEDMPQEEKARGWAKVEGRQALLEEGVSLYAGQNYIDVRMNNLWADFGTRYRATLRALVKATNRGVLAYRPKQSKENKVRDRTEEEKKIEAVRVKFRKYWHAVAYEHNLILPADIGAVLLKELEPQDMAGGQYKGTVYTKGYEGKESLKVRVYDMSEKHGEDNVKIEVVLRQDYLERHYLKDPNTWETQPDIQEKIKSTLEREWRILFKEARGARAMLAERVNTGQAELFSFMANTKNTFTEHRARIEALEAGQAEMKRRIEMLEETAIKRERAE